MIAPCSYAADMAIEAEADQARQEQRYYLAWNDDGALTVEDDREWWESLDDAKTELDRVARELRDSGDSETIGLYAIVQGLRQRRPVYRIVDAEHELVRDPAAARREVVR